MDFRGKNIDLVGKQNLWFGFSIAVIIIGMVSWFVFKPNLGIDFKGGGQLQYLIPYSKRPTAGQEVTLIRDTTSLLEKKGLRGIRIQIVGGDTLTISTHASNDAQLNGEERMITETLKDPFTGTDKQNRPQSLQLLARQVVGPVIGEELRANAVKGVVLGVFLIALWIYIRYNFAGDGLRYAVAGIIALVHDVLVLGGIFALIGHFFPKVEMDSTFIAALLTVVGYSINDSVVIFDRIRENLRLRRKEPFNKVVNDSLLETMSRSINTGATVLIMLFVLLLFGGESIFNFILAMLIGIASGLYSSIFNASMVLTAWHSYDEKKAEAARAARGTAPRGGRTVTSSASVRETPSRPVLAGGGGASTTATPTATPPADTTPAPSNDGSGAASTPSASSAAKSSQRKARSKRRY